MTSFRPLPLLGNPHVQTILGNLLQGVQAEAKTELRLVPLPDGDHVVLHENAPGKLVAPSPIALLVHGLGGSARSAYMRRMSKRLAEMGWRVFRMDMRGAGASVRLARRYYNAGCSGDVAAAVAYLNREFASSPVAVFGFSLGGNIVLKYAGEGAGRLPSQLAAVVAVAPPIDLVRCSELIARYPFYDAFYVYHLTRQVTRHWQQVPGVPKIVFPRRLTLLQFDELYTAPRWGYKGAVDYYLQASALPVMSGIQVPTFILTARDDPFVAVESFEMVGSPTVEVRIPEKGGHLGFLGKDESGGVRWAETTILAWVAKQIKGCLPFDLLK